MVKYKGSTSSNLHKNKRKILYSPHTFPILLKIFHGYRPSQIAEQLRISPQLVNYYTDNLIELKLIEKLGGRLGLEWKLTSQGLFILKEKLRGSVNNNNNNNNDDDDNALYSISNIQTRTTIPIRLHNTSFGFKLVRMSENIRLRWIQMKNGVLKCNIKYPEYFIEIVKSPKDIQSSVMLIHLNESYFFDPYNAIIEQYDTARSYAQIMAKRLNLTISEKGQLVKKPHFAFEYDIIALLLATFQTAEISTAGGMTWIDSSPGRGELETNDIDYAYKYLRMPEIVMELENTVSWIKSKITGYARCYDPIFTDNN
jgi:hypothetical protein